VLQEPIRGHAGIAAYWQEKVVKGQSRIGFTLLNTYLDGTTGIAEWEVFFDDCAQRQRKHMKEIAIMEFVDGKIASLREYWALIGRPANRTLTGLSMNPHAIESCCLQALPSWGNAFG
jgi:hypothetical protein